MASRSVASLDRSRRIADWTRDARASSSDDLRHSVPIPCVSRVGMLRGLHYEGKDKELVCADFDLSS